MRHARPSRPGHPAELARGVLDLLQPRACLGCGRPGHSLCPACSGILAGTPFRHHRPNLTRMPCLYAASAYEGIARTAILQWKERAHRDLGRPLAHALATAVAFGMRDLGIDAPVTIVPVPPSAMAMRTRGEDVLGRLARLAARDLTRRGLAADVRHLLALTRTPRDQAGLGTFDRQENVLGAMRARPWGPASPAVVIVVDDVVTTGATVAEASRALTAAGWALGLAATVAATSRKVYGDECGW